MSINNSNYSFMVVLMPCKVTGYVSHQLGRISETESLSVNSRAKYKLWRCDTHSLVAA